MPIGLRAPAPKKRPDPDWSYLCPVGCRKRHDWVFHDDAPATVRNCEAEVGRSHDAEGGVGLVWLCIGCRAEIRPGYSLVPVTRPTRRTARRNSATVRAQATELIADAQLVTNGVRTGRSSSTGANHSNINRQRTTNARAPIGDGMLVSNGMQASITFESATSSTPVFPSDPTAGVFAVAPPRCSGVITVTRETYRRMNSPQPGERFNLSIIHPQLRGEAYITRFEMSGEPGCADMRTIHWTSTGAVSFQPISIPSEQHASNTQNPTSEPRVPRRQVRAVPAR